ncbi:MAG TPA: RluA family pseudouridine synthase [Polyangiaceae bacterium]
MVVVVSRAQAGARLDRFLAGALGVSRSELQRWIEAGRVTVGGVARDASSRVREGESVEVEPMAPASSDAVPEAGVVFEVLHVDDAVVVVNKPPGLVVHPARGHEGGTLVNGLLARGFFAAGEGDHERPGIVHRLDKGTSGVMVVARTPEAREALKAQFQAHSIERAYVAIVAGEVRVTEHATLHGRHPRDRMRFTTKVRTGKRAVTHVRVLEKGEGVTLVECTLETGRTHQIRVHLAESGTPVLGDPLYGRPPRDPALRAAAERLGHQALHARVLGFVHPATGKPVRFEVSPPPDFLALWSALRPAGPGAGA